MVVIREGPYLMVAKEELQPLALRIIPKTHALRLAAEGEDAAVEVDFKGGATTARFTRVDEKDEFRLDGTTLILDPYEIIAFSSSAGARAHGGGCVELKRVASGVLSVPFNDYTTADANLRPNKGSKTRLDCKIHYWTNEKKVPKGSALALAGQPVH